MGALDAILGVNVIASWANMILFTIEIQQMIQYFTRYPKDSWVNKGAVIFCLLTESVTVLCCLIVVYLYGVTHWGVAEYLATQPWAIPTSTISAALTNVAVQIWLTKMVYSLTKQWIWPVLIGLLILPSLPCAFYTAHLLFGDLSYAANVGLGTWVTIWFTTSAATDVAITAVLVWKFSAYKTRFTSTKSLIRRLILASVRNGSITTVLTWVVPRLNFHYTQRPTRVEASRQVYSPLPAYTEHKPNLTPSIKFVVGRFYALSLLSNLNSRQDALGTSGQGTHSHSVSHKVTGGEHPTTGTALRIRQDIETHYHTDDTIPMRDLEYGKKAREVHGDGSSDANLEVIVEHC
ncbi:hypothetical protein DFH08DRAFT_989496 [Mycena albidolilacea]|uniref:DUF6534 domain-containing protein n=1 Tax=Mycena albidolilacea TaxID=1033008 RepID=A0AAD7E8N5_9AGAR|nr:hypothetical protein DFH08DRAFT_989496 [Mycena albidolilacea]